MLARVVKTRAVIVNSSERRISERSSRGLAAQEQHLAVVQARQGDPVDRSSRPRLTRIQRFERGGLQRDLLFRQRPPSRRTTRRGDRPHASFFNAKTACALNCVSGSCSAATCAARAEDEGRVFRRTRVFQVFKREFIQIHIQPEGVGTLNIAALTALRLR